MIIIFSVTSSNSILDLKNDLYFVNRTDFKLILPKRININKVMKVFALCNYDDCKMTFLFQCLKYEDQNDVKKLVDIYDLAVFKRNLSQNKSELVKFDLPNSEPNLERCLETDLNQRSNQIAIETRIQFINNLNVINQNIVKHKFDLILSSYSYVKILIDLPIYRKNQLIRFIILPFNLNFEPFTQTIHIRLLTPNRLIAKRWSLNFFSYDQLNRFEYRLSNLPPIGLWTIETIVLDQIFKKSFFVIAHG